MKIIRHGHACLLIETETTRILIDPGNYTSTWHDLGDLSGHDVGVVTIRDSEERVGLFDVG